jgi:hypothetical protein
MRELEFLPTWYPVMRRRRKLAVTQAWTTAILMGAVGLFGIAGHQHVLDRQAQAETVTAELRRIRGELRMLDEQLLLKQQLQQQETVLRKLGLQVDATRLLGEIQHFMGEQIFLLEMYIDTEEATRVPTPRGDNPLVRTEESAESSQRLLKVKLIGVSPSDVEVADFLTGLTTQPYFDNVAMTYAKDLRTDGRLMRQFEVTFSVDLGGGAR